MKKSIVHESTNPHYIQGDVTEVVSEESFVSVGECHLVTNPSHHEDLTVPFTGPTDIEFIQTQNITGEVRRVCD